jgi:hypothetical protein
MIRSLSVTIGLVVLAATGLAGCSTGKEDPAAATTTATASSPPTTPSAPPAASSTPAGTGSASPTESATTTSSPATNTEATSGTPMVGGMTECTRAALAEPATGAAQSLGPDNVYTVEDLSCADGWAVTSGLLADKSNPNMGAPTSFVFEQQGQFWVLKDKAMVCGTNPVTTTPPADAEIPAELFLAGCAAG